MIMSPRMLSNNDNSVHSIDELINAPSQPAASPKLNFVKKVAITTDTEGGSARPEIVTTTDRVL